MRKLIVCFLMFTLCFGAGAEATYLDMTSRGAGFGGALCNNATGVDALYYNPANLSKGVSEFSFDPAFTFSLGEFFNVAKDPESFLLNTFSENKNIGGNLGFSIGLTRGSFGFFLRPDVQLTYSKLAGINPMNINALGVSELGFGYGREIYKGLSMGMTFKYIYSYEYKYVTETSTAATMNNTEASERGKGMAFDLGFTRNINDWLSVGIVWVDLINYVGYEMKTKQSITDVSGNTTTVAGSATTVKSSRRRPVRTLFGVGIRKEKVGFEVDVETYDHTTDVHIGLEGILSDKLLGRLGFSTDRANNTSALSLGFKAGPLSLTANLDLRDSRNNSYTFGF